MTLQVRLRDTFLKKYPHLRFGLGDWRSYGSGVWARTSREDVLSHIQDITPRDKLTFSLTTNVLGLLQPKARIPDILFDHNPHVLTFNNCCLDLTTFQPIAHSPEYYASDKLNFDYDPGARSTAWDKVVESFPYVDVLQRFAGLALTTETKYEVALWLHGPPGGGKSTFIAGLEAMLGTRACVLGLDEIGRNNFALSQLPGKTLAVSTEQPAGFVKCAHKLNSIISGESITVEQKFKPQFTLMPKVKLLWAMNELPLVPAGAGAGLFRRIYPVYWPGLADSERDPGLKEEISRSGMAIVNWALEGLKRLRQKGRFELPPELTTAQNAYREESDLTLCFITDCCDVGEDEEVQASDLYEAYGKWCTQNGHRSLASNRFATDLQRLGYSKTRRSIGVFWLGIALKPDFPDFIVDI